MTTASNNHSPDPGDDRVLGRWERWEVHDGEPVVVWDHEAHAVWLEKWAPRCPDGNAQRLAHLLGFRERSIGELELRVPLCDRDLGVCQVIVDEQEDEVHVRALVCYDDERPFGPREYTNWPVRVWLEEPLGDRAVIDVDSDEELPLFTPDWSDDTRPPEADYRPANRRRRPASPS